MKNNGELKLAAISLAIVVALLFAVGTASWSKGGEAEGLWSLFWYAIGVYSYGWAVIFLSLLYIGARMIRRDEEYDHKGDFPPANSHGL